jgi:hypothetical protein
MKIMVEMNGAHYYRTCSDAHHWDGVVRTAPDWLQDMMADGDATLTKEKMLTMRTKNGYIIADVGDIIVCDGDNIDIMRKFG